MNKEKLKKLGLLCLFLIIIDQFTKILVLSLYVNEVDLKILSIELFLNTGIAFSLNDGNIRNIVIICILLIFIIRFVVLNINKFNRLTIIAWSLVISGAISNMIDRIIRGGVVDFIKIESFSVFNIADIFVVSGWILLVILMMGAVKDIEVKSERNN